MTHYEDKLQKYNKDKCQFFHKTKWTLHKRPQLVESSECGAGECPTVPLSARRAKSEAVSLFVRCTKYRASIQMPLTSPTSRSYHLHNRTWWDSFKKNQICQTLSLSVWKHKQFSKVQQWIRYAFLQYTGELTCSDLRSQIIVQLHKNMMRTCT